MMQKTLLILMLLSFNLATIMAQNKASTIFDFKVEDISGNIYDFKQLKGKKIMIVNTASECGFTPQYETLEELYKQFGGEKFEIIGFPSNNFGAQEPGSNKEIDAFCKLNYGVSFPMMSKINVTGEKMHPLYQWLTKKEMNGVEETEVTWNFQKFLIDENGVFVTTVAPNESPACERILNWIQE